MYLSNILSWNEFYLGILSLTGAMLAIAEPVPSRNSCVRRKLKGIGFRLTNLPLYSLSVYIRLILIFERKMIVEMQHFRVYMCHYAREIGKPFFTNSYLSSFLAKFESFHCTFLLIWTIAFGYDV